MHRILVPFCGVEIHSLILRELSSCYLQNLSLQKTGVGAHQFCLANLAIEFNSYFSEHWYLEIRAEVAWNHHLSPVWIQVIFCVKTVITTFLLQTTQSSDSSPIINLVSSIQLFHTLSLSLFLYLLTFWKAVTDGVLSHLSKFIEDRKFLIWHIIANSA